MLQTIDELRYDPVKDLYPVDQLGFLDLADAYLNHSIPADIASQPSEFNGIDDPSSVLGVPHDFAEAAQFRATISDHKKKDDNA